MIVVLLVMPVWLTHAYASQQSSVSRARSSADCREWQACRQLAVEAADRHDYEAFHDLAWRAVQLGARNDPALMYLLARAQCLSGRPHDALIMLERLAQRGVASDAATNDDFQRTRALPGWPEVDALIERVRSDGATGIPLAASSSASGPTSTSPPTAPGAATVSGRASRSAVARASAVPGHSASPAAGGFAVFKPEPVEQAVRISIARFSAGGLAYDAVSGRFVVGDMHGRKLIVISQGADHAVDLVRAESAGFHDIKAIEIDDRRGDLWVATSTPEDSEWTVHRLQLVSGRPLKALHVPADLEPMKLVDLAVSASGTVLALDAARNRLLELRSGESSLKPVLTLAVQGPTSVTATDDEGVAYVAHGTGIVKVDLRTPTAVPVGVPPGFELGRIERIRWHRNALLAVQVDANGSRRLVRFDLSASGRAVIAATVIDGTIPSAAGPTFATVSGDELSYLVADPDGSSQSETSHLGGLAEFIVRRIHLH
jgi:hypothetical protein